MPVDLIYPLVTNRTWRNDKSRSCGNWLHCHKAMGTVERPALQVLLFVVYTFCMLPQVTFQALHTSFVVSQSKLTTDAFKTIFRGIKWKYRAGMLYATASTFLRKWGLDLWDFLLHSSCSFRNISIRMTAYVTGDREAAMKIRRLWDHSFSLNIFVFYRVLMICFRFPVIFASCTIIMFFYGDILMWSSFQDTFRCYITISWFFGLSFSINQFLLLSVFWSPCYLQSKFNQECQTLQSDLTVAFNIYQCYLMSSCFTCSLVLSRFFCSL